MRPSWGSRRGKVLQQTLPWDTYSVLGTSLYLRVKIAYRHRNKYGNFEISSSDAWCLPRRNILPQKL